MEYKTRQWHEKCFACCVCQTHEQEIYCTGCYEQKFATRCIKCDKVRERMPVGKTPVRSIIVNVFNLTYFTTDPHISRFSVSVPQGETLRFWLG